VCVGVGGGLFMFMAQRVRYAVGEGKQHAAASHQPTTDCVKAQVSVIFTLYHHHPTLLAMCCPLPLSSPPPPPSLGTPTRLAESSLQQLVPQLTTAQEGAAALLIEVKADTQQGLQDVIKRAQGVLSSSGTKFGGQANQPLGVESYAFSTDPQVGP